MDDSMGAGLMAVIAVSGSIVFLSLQLHKRLLSDFMQKIEFELGSVRDEMKKRATILEDTETRYDEHDADEMKMKKMAWCDRRVGSKIMKEGSMPGNRQAMYKGILQYRKLSSPCI